MLGMSYVGWEGPWARVLGLLAASLERWDDACAHFEDAIACCRRLGARPCLARTEYEYGRALIARGRRDASARALIASARARPSALGMTGLVRLADAKLADARRARRHADAAVRTGRAAAAARRRARRPPFTFAHEGEYWAVTYAGATFRLKDSLGIQYLVRLIEAAGAGDPRARSDRRAGGRRGANEAIDTGDAGELLDDEARRSYQRRLEDLRETVAEAESFGDAARAAARARGDRDAGRGAGAGGRARGPGAPGGRGGRARAQRRPAPDQERHRTHRRARPGAGRAPLSKAVRTGNFCVYRPS